MPILGILASSKLTAAATSYESIATVTVGAGGTGSVSFSSIPTDGTYKHLQIRGILRNTSGAYNFASITFNGSYPAIMHRLEGDGTSAYSFSETSTSRFLGVISAGGSSTANAFGAAVIDVLDYASTNKYKTTRILGGVDLNGTGVATLSSNLWQSTSAISSLTIYPAAGSWAQYSHFALYGIKGA